MKLCAYMLALLIMAAAFSTVRVTPAEAVPVGSFTFTYGGNAPDGTTIRIGVKTKIPFGAQIPPGTQPPFESVFDFTLDISGNDKNQATDRLAAQLRNRGLVIAPRGSNSLDVLGTDSQRVFAIAGGSTKPGFPVRLDGSDVDITRNLKPGSKWKVAFEPIFKPTQAVAGGSETVSLQDRIPDMTLLVLSTTVPSDSTAEEAALLFDQLLVGAGLPDVGMSDAEVSFLEAPFDSTIRVVPDIPDLAFDGSNLFYTLTFPETTVPAPGTLMLLGMGLLLLQRLRRRKSSR